MNDEGPQRAASVLVVDDDKQVLEVLRRGLAAYGFTVVTASDGNEAIERFRAEQDFDMLLSKFLTIKTQPFAVAGRLPVDVRGLQLFFRTSVCPPTFLWSSSLLMQLTERSIPLC